MQRTSRPSGSWRTGAGDRSIAFLATLSLGLAGTVGCMASVGDEAYAGTVHGTGVTEVSPGTGGSPVGTGGSPNGEGGRVGAGGSGMGGQPGTGGSITGTGGRVGTGGSGMGGGVGLGGARGTGGGISPTGTGGASDSGAGTDAGPVADPCTANTPLTGPMVHSSSNASGTAAGLAWTIWSNGGGGSITTYDHPAFSAAWNNSGDFLARIGLQWNQTKTFDAYGTIKAQFAYKKTGSGGGYSYIGIYGWSVSPCIEFYIVDDSYNKMPVNPGNTVNKGTAMIDGGTYNLYTRATTGTGGSKCPGTSNWTQFYSVRTTARQCGQISITDHFKAWAAAGMTLGKMDQAQLLVEVGGGVGSVDFTTASVTAQ